MRVNPRNRSIKSIYKTYIQVTHIDVEHNSSVGGGNGDSQVGVIEPGCAEDSTKGAVGRELRCPGRVASLPRNVL